MTKSDGCNYLRAQYTHEVRRERRACSADSFIHLNMSQVRQIKEENVKHRRPTIQCFASYAKDAEAILPKIKTI